MLNMTEDKLELISDAGIYLFFAKSMRSRAFYITDRCSEANNKCLKSYDPQKSKHIIYLGPNDLYHYALSKFLPTNYDSNKYSSINSEGFVLEVDPEYLKEFRKLDNDCPLALDKIEIKKELLFNPNLGGGIPPLLVFPQYLRNGKS